MWNSIETLEHFVVHATLFSLDGSQMESVTANKGQISKQIDALGKSYSHVETLFGTQTVPCMFYRDLDQNKVAFAVFNDLSVRTSNV
jgi:hypothetical protein